jgi:uncharacterized protein YndB with AHSA1/START domain
MKILKKILIVIVALIALFFIIALFVSKEYTVERSLVINRPDAEVFDYLKHIKNQDNYSVWNMADPNKKQTFEGTDGTVGFKNAWNGNDKVGEGEQQITAIDEGKRIDVSIHFKRPMESDMAGYTLTQPVDAGSTKVTSVVHGVNSYPMNIMNLMMDGMLGKDMQQNLENLKAILEKQ